MNADQQSDQAQMGWPLYAGLAAAALLLCLLALVLWGRSGQNLFANRLLAVVAGCF